MQALLPGERAEQTRTRVIQNPSRDTSFLIFSPSDTADFKKFAGGNPVGLPLAGAGNSVKAWKNS